MPQQQIVGHFMKILPSTPRRCRLLRAKVAWMAVLTLGVHLAAGQATNTNTNPSTTAGTEADLAWKELQKALRPPMPPAEWQSARPTPEQIEAFRAQQGQLAGQAADKAQDFYTRFPNHPMAAEARKKRYEMLQFAVQLGNTNKVAALETSEQER